MREIGFKNYGMVAMVVRMPVASTCVLVMIDLIRSYYDRANMPLLAVVVAMIVVITILYRLGDLP